MVNVLWERGEVAASMNLEDLFDQLSDQHGIAIFCSFLMDNFSGDVHARMLPRLGDNDSHLIPVEDYARLERAVSDALRETVGPDESRVLESRLLSSYPGTFHMPRSQALLLALRQILPQVAENALNGAAASTTLRCEGVQGYLYGQRRRNWRGSYGTSRSG